MEKLISRCKRCAMTSDVPYMLVCPRCGADMYTYNSEPTGVKPKRYGLFSAYVAMFKKATDFRTRSRRSEYWFAFLMNFIVSFSILYSIVALSVISSESLQSLNEGDGLLSWIYRAMYFLYSVYSLLVLIPQLSLTVRRLHDIGKSPFFAVFSFSPLLSLALIYFMVQDSMPGDNMHGPNPKGIQ